MRIKIITTMKNEDDLLRPWIRYHAKLVGAQNLLVFDNGSTSTKVLRIVDWARRSGVVIDQSQPSQEDFLMREDRYTELIKAVDRRKGADFHFPMDCDEFLAIKEGERVSIGRDPLVRELANYRKSPNPLKALASLDNNPNHPGFFRWVTTFEKRFFAVGACEWLGGGFHDARSKTSAPPLTTNVVYIHFQLKPYDVLVAHARAKLAPWLDDFSRPALNAHVERRGVAFHCAQHLLRSSEEYDAMLDQLHRSDDIHFPEIEAAFRTVGEPLPFSNDNAVCGDEPPPPGAARRSSWSVIGHLFSRGS